MRKSEDLLSKLDSNGSNNVFKRNNLDQDKNRPDSGISHARYVDVDQMSYAEFCAFCSKVYIDNTNGSKPVGYTNSRINEKIICRKHRQVLR